jgi:hypothetical protein
MREEILAMGSNGKVQRDIQTNTEKYLSLELPPSHNFGMLSVHYVFIKRWFILLDIKKLRITELHIPYL